MYSFGCYTETETLLEQATIEGYVVCKCGNHLEPDCPECPDCGWKNPLVTGGYI